ncbi:MAG TPA: hypothetical protein VGU46_14200 [Acidobacteriaceae bacterium]|nr:hypothetical protein [Acidobacteriaceae bacterium]
MIRRNPSRTLRGFGAFACCGIAAFCCGAGLAQAVAAQNTEVAATQVGAEAPAVSKRQAHDADQAYLAGAKKAGRGDIAGAQRDFERAAQLNPGDATYAAAVALAREHRVNGLVQRATKARMGGDDAVAATLLAEARSIDPESAMVIEHSGPFVRQGVGARMSAGAEDLKIQAPVPTGSVRLAPAAGVKSFDLRGASADVLLNVGNAYGIRVVMDDSLEQKTLRFNLQNATYEQAMGAAMNMAHAFAVPVDEKSVIVAADSADNRQRLERQLEETIYLPGLRVEEINDLAQVVRSVFDVKQASIEAGLGKILVRAPQDTLDPLNVTLKDLINSSGEVMIDVKLYDVATTHTVHAGATIPNQFTVFNVDQAADAIVNANQTLVQQAIAQGYITSSTSNLDIALALINLGLVKSDLATNLIGVFGGGLLKTGISGSTAVTLNLGLNSSDSRALDDLQMRIGDRQEAVFREGEKYPITQSTYSAGGTPTLPAGVGNATIGGVSLNSLLAQYTGGPSATIPIVTYEDLGLTLRAKPVIEKSGRINLLLDLKIEALSGSMLDGNPILNNRQFSTDLTVADGESALMVSDVNRNESDAISGLPGLGALPGFDIPVDDARDRGKSQLVVVVTPHIVRRRSDMIAGPRIPLHGRVDD